MRDYRGKRVRVRKIFKAVEVLGAVGFNFSI